MKTILEVQNVSKKFLIGSNQQPYLSFRDRIQDVFSLTKTRKQEFWALKDLSFKIEQGDSVGIIGKNGAGKSTLLKILSRITPPTKGRIKIRGRIASLLEVGTGFHQELTGRENIFMNGSILGMKNAEIKARFDEIVAFSGTELFLDTPLKHYSSGMQLRLAFAVAAHLEPEVLIIDEVLAVGDQEFQKKCISKMKDVRQEGKTLLFVSHNLSMLKTLCGKGLLLKAGELVCQGTIDETISEYSKLQQKKRSLLDGVKKIRDNERVEHLEINGEDSNSLTLTSPSLRIKTIITFTQRVSFELQVHIKREGTFLCSYANLATGEVKWFDPGTYEFEYDLHVPNLRSGKYTLDIYYTEPFVTWFAHSLDDIEFDYVNTNHELFLNAENYNWWGNVLIEGNMNQLRID
jgi:lipopolysaccharide transport system ATP-binding protein